jgi:hypothetical protein
VNVRTTKRLLVIGTVLVLGYIALAFARPYYQYAMMYQAFDDAVDGGMARIQMVQARVGEDVSNEVIAGMQAFFAQRAAELALPADALRIDVRVWAGRLVARVAWEAPVHIGNYTAVLDFAIERERRLYR